MRVVSRRVSRIDMSSRNLFTLPVHGKLCTCLGSFVSRREKNLIPLTGHGETEHGEPMDFVLLGKTFRYILAKRFEDGMLSEEQLRHNRIDKKIGGRFFFMAFL